MKITYITYIIENSIGEQFQVKFQSERQLYSWIENEKNYFNKEYKIIK